MLARVRLFVEARTVVEMQVQHLMIFVRLMLIVWAIMDERLWLLLRLSCCYRSVLHRSSSLLDMLAATLCLSRRKVASLLHSESSKLRLNNRRNEMRAKMNKDDLGQRWVNLQITPPPFEF